MISLKRLLAGLKSAPAARTATPAGPPSAAGYLASGFSFTAAETAGYFFAYHKDAFFTLGEGEELVLTTPPVAEPGKTLARIVINAECSGEPVQFAILTEGADGQAREAEIALSSGVSAVASPDEDAAVVRLRLRMRGEGRFRITAIRPRYFTDAFPVPAKAPNPLLELVFEDYERARKGGAEIPRPPLEHVF